METLLDIIINNPLPFTIMVVFIAAAVWKGLRS